MNTKADYLSIYLRIVLVLSIIACVALAIILPLSAATARPYAWAEHTIALTEFNARSWSLYGLDFDDYENYPVNSQLGDSATLTFVFDGLIVTQHQFDVATSTNTFVRSFLFIADYNYPGYATIDQETGELYVDCGTDDYYTYDLFTGNYSVWFVPLGYISANQQATNIRNLDDFADNLTNHSYGNTFYNYVGTSQEIDRTARGAYNLLYRQQAILAANSDNLEYSRGYNNGYNIGNQDGFINGKAEGVTIGYQRAENDIMQSKQTLFQFIGSIFTAPSHFINTVFDFEIFGFNVAALVRFLLTMLIVALVTGWLIRKGV